MTSNNREAKQHYGDVTTPFNKWAYAAFVVLAVYFLFRNDLFSAASNLGIALIFDPFNPAVKWGDGRTWQKVWMLVHLAVTLALVGYELWVKW